MPKSNKTSSVLKMLNLNETPAAVKPQPVKIISEPPETNTPVPARHPRKNITKYLKLSDTGTANPALKAIEPPADLPSAAPELYVRISNEKQIVSIPLMLVNEQLGAAVERFNVCACDVCLRAILINAMDLMPPMFVRVVSAKDEEEVNRLIAERRAEAIRVLAKVCITGLSKPFHEK